MLKQMLELSDSFSRKLLKEAPNNFINFLCECLINVINGNVPVKQTVSKKLRDFISAVIIKGNKSEEKTIYFGQKIRTYQGNRILVLSLIESQIMQAQKFVLITRGCSYQKIPPLKKFLIINISRKSHSVIALTKI